MGLDFLVPIFGIMIVLVPVTGLTAVLTLRLGGKPFIETLAREMRGLSGGSGQAVHLQIAELSDQVEALTTEVRELRAAQAFDESLIESASRLAQPGPGSRS